MTGAVPFDVADLVALAALLEVPLSTFIQLDAGVISRYIPAPGLGAAA
jgi:hypothetical protein